MRSIFLPVFFSAMFIAGTSFAQQVNGVFTPFAKNNLWGNVVINTATYENSGHITLGGYYEGALKIVTVNNVQESRPNKIPLLMQLNPWGTFRSNFGSGGYAMFTAPTSNLGSCTIDKTYIANASSNPASIQYILAGHNEDGAGYMMKTFVSGARPIAYNGGDIRFFNESGIFSRNRFVEDWVYAQYTVRKAGISFTDQKIVLSSYSTSTGAPVASFGNNGNIDLPVPDQQTFNDTLPVKTIIGGDGKLYVAFSVKTTSLADEIILYRILTGPVAKIDSSFGTAGIASFPVPNPYSITSINYHANQSITVGGSYTDPSGVPSFYNFSNQGDIQTTTSYNYAVGAPNPGYGCKNISAKLATVNGEERIVFTYSKPTATPGRYAIAIASHKPGGGADPLLFSPWQSDEFISAEPAEIIVTSNTGFVVAGNATRPNGTIAGVVIKYKTDGSIDPTFGTGGSLIINGIASGQSWSDMAQLPDNKYLAVGNGFVPEDRGKGGLLFQKFRSNGDIDSSFGDNGTVFAYKSTYGRTARHVRELPGGKFLIGGTYTNYQNEPGIGTGTAGSKATVYRIMPDGTPDNTFAFNGKLHYSGAGGMTYIDLKVQDDTIYMAGNVGTTHAGGGKAYIYKITPNGSPYSAFLPRLPFLHCFTISENTGNAFVGGGINGTPKQICKVKQGPQGFGGYADSSFGINGLVSQALINSGEETEIKEIKILPGYLFVVSTWREGNGASTPGGIFFNSITSDGGVMNTSWGTNGNKFLQLPGATSIALDQLKWINNGYNLLLFGRALVAGVTKGFICKVDTNGDLVTTYGTGGVIWTNETIFASSKMITNNEDDLVIIENLGFLGGGALSKLKVPAAVFHMLQPGVWLGTVDNDWFKAGNWQAGAVPGEYTEVVINGGNIVIGGNRNAHAFNLTLLAGATLTVQPGSSLDISSDDD
ncbi:MAG: delta-60 repeat domain-containing protein [Rhizobacter sp.]|nr:delta-60 repeat domain-containing protein [Ferruginibacter sp.]